MSNRTSSYNNAEEGELVKARSYLNPVPSVTNFQHDATLKEARRIIAEHAVPAPPPIPAPDPSVPAVAAGLTLKWSDEFGGSGLAPGKWVVLDGEGAWDDSGLEEYRASQVSVRDGLLHLTAVPNPNAPGKWLSGAVSTRGQYAPDVVDRYAFTQGYAEARIRCPHLAPSWPAFWLVGAKGAPPWPAYGEFDVVEHYGTRLGEYEATTHFAKVGDSDVQEGGWAIKYPSGAATDWHTYGVRWTPSALQYVLDGKVVQQWTPPDATAAKCLALPHTLILNLAVGGDNLTRWHGWDGKTYAPADVPAVMDVDYVRVYQ